MNVPNLKKTFMKLLQWLLVCCIVFPLRFYGQSADDQLFRAAMSASSDSAKLAGLNKLIITYPQSKLVGDAYGAQFSVLMSLHRDSAAFFAVHNYLAAKDSQSLPGALHNVAMELTFRKQYPDSALLLVDSAISLYREKHGRLAPVLLYTRATSLFLLKRFAEAESTEREAITLLPASAIFDPRYSNYFAQLGMIQLETHPGVEGLDQYVHASFVSSQPSVEYANMDSLFHSRVKDSTSVVRVRDSLFERTANEYLHNFTDTSRAKSFIAESFSRNRVFTGRALQFAREAYREAAMRSFQERCDAAASLGIVLSNTGHNGEAEKFLVEALQTALPSATELFLALGSVQESLGKKNEAFTTYLAGVVVSRPSVLMKPLQALQKELYPHASIDSMITVALRRWVDFFPEKYQRPDSLDGQPNQKTVLAELFTGSECRPCQAADIAYNKLLERYDRAELAVLEYHLHIPRPDPMANTDTELRSEYYGVNSTPTSIIDGTNVINSGGLGIAARAKFAVYADAVDHSLTTPAKASVKISAKIRRSKVSFVVSASVTNARKSYKLRVVLAEDRIRYQGTNGISEHRFVVRKMIRGAGGTSFNQNGKVTVKDAFAVSTIEDQLENYLTTYEEKMQKPGTLFKEKKSEIDPKQLYIVAFVQDDATHRILESTIVKVKR
jgi:tetratricopeptide (TPR) repeat protein